MTFNERNPVDSLPAAVSGNRGLNVLVGCFIMLMGVGVLELCGFLPPELKKQGDIFFYLGLVAAPLALIGGGISVVRSKKNKRTDR